MLLFDVGLTLTALNTEENSKGQGNGNVPSGRNLGVGDALDFATMSFGMLTRAIRDNYLQPASANAPQPLTNPQPSTGGGWISILTNSVNQARDWARGIVIDGSVGPSGSTPATTGGTSNINTLFGGLVSRVQTGFDDMAQWLSGTQTRSASYRSPLEASVATLTGITERLTALVEVRKELVTAVRSHNSELTKDQRQELLDTIRQLDNTVARQWGLVGDEYQRCNRVLQSRAPQLCPAADQAFQESTCGCQNRVERFRGRLAEIQERIESNQATADEIRAFQEEIRQMMEESGGLSQEIQDTPRQMHSLLDAYAREIDAGAWESVADEMRSIRDEYEREHERMVDESSEAVEDFCLICERYGDALDTQWVPMLGPMGEGPYAVSNLYFYGELDALMKQIHSDSMYGQADLYAQTHEFLSSETVLSEEEDTIVADFIEEEPEPEPKSLEAPVIGDVEQQLEVQEEERLEAAMRRLELRHGIRGFDRDNPSADLLLTALQPDDLIELDEERVEAERVSIQQAAEDKALELLEVESHRESERVARAEVEHVEQEVEHRVEREEREQVAAVVEAQLERVRAELEQVRAALEDGRIEDLERLARLEEREDLLEADRDETTPQRGRHSGAQV